MKRSKILQSSKDILSRSFNSAKCKTSLRMAASRLKVLKNQKQAQAKHMKKEIAQLLESGQEQTARMRVEHVIREEKMMAAYELLEIYCELIVARLPLIESQKNCPIDLKEAVASVVFASLRCGDVVELLDVRKQFSAKYGKDFTTAAIELRPQSGVGRMLVEKLSAGAPDVQTKTKILSVIAEEHNVKWDHEVLEEKASVLVSDIPSKQYVEHPRYEATGSQMHSSITSMHNVSSNVLQKDSRTSAELEKLTAATTSGVESAFQPEARPLSGGSSRAQSHQGDGNNSSSLGRHRWNMEFKDATSAAQAAAESAELASIAAKAAAELSSRNKILQPHGSDNYVVKDEGTDAPSNFKFSQERYPEESGNGQIDMLNSRGQATDAVFKVGDHGSPEKRTQSVDFSMYHDAPIAQQYSPEKSLENVSREKTSVETESFKHEAETSSEKAKDLPHSVISSHSHPSFDDEVNIFADSEDLKYESDIEEHPSVNIGTECIHEGEASQESSHVVYDKFDSDKEDHGFDTSPTLFDDHYSTFNLPEHPSVKMDSWSPRTHSTEHADSTLLFFTGENSYPEFSENSASKDVAKLDYSAPLAFDDSDGPDSGIDEDMNTRHFVAEDSRDNLVGNTHKREQSSTLQFDDIISEETDRLWPRVNTKQLPSSSESDEVDHLRTDLKKVETASAVELSHGRYSSKQPALGPEEPQTEFIDESSVDSTRDLSLGKLTGGLRNKVTVFKKETGKATGSSIPQAVERPNSSKTSYNEKPTLDLHFASDSDSSEDSEVLQRSSGLKLETYTPKDDKSKLSLDAADTNFGSDSHNLDNNPLKEALARKSHLRSGISRRTRAAPPSSGSNLYSKKAHLRSEANDTDTVFNRKPVSSDSSDAEETSEPQRRDSGKWVKTEQPTSTTMASKPAESTFWQPPEKQDPPKSTSALIRETSPGRPRSEVADSGASMGEKTNTQLEFQSMYRYSGRLDNSEQPTSKRDGSKPATGLWGTSEKPNSGKTTSTVTQKPKITQKSSAVEEPSGPRQKMYSDRNSEEAPTKPATGLWGTSNSGKATSTVIQKPKISSAVEEPSGPRQKMDVSVGGRNSEEAPTKVSSNKTESPKRASHVHPKLPDYDTLLQTLRMKRS